MKCTVPTLLLLASLAAFGPEAARAQQLPYAERVAAQAPEGAALSLDEAVAMVEKRFKARVVRAETREEKGRTLYVLRLLSQSEDRVWTVRVDAASGAVR